jgi:hypothetical protein
VTVPGLGGTPPVPPGYVPPGLPDTAAGSVNIFRGRLVIVFGPAGTVSGIFVYTPGTTPGLGNPPVVSITESSTDPYGNVLSGGVVVGTPSNPQVQIQSVSGVGKLVFKLNSSGYSDGLINGGFASGIGVISIQGPASTTAGHIDFVSHVISAADGMATHFANEEWAYTDISGTFRTYAFVDGSGFSATAVNQLTATDPTTGTAPANPAIGETWHDLRPLTNSFVGTIASRYPPQYRKLADGNVQIEGCIQCPNAANPNTITFANLASAYRPGANTGHKWPATIETNVAPVGTPICQIDTSGNLQLHNFPTVGMNNVVVCISGIYPLDNTGLILS